MATAYEEMCPSRNHTASWCPHLDFDLAAALRDGAGGGAGAGARGAHTAAAAAAGGEDRGQALPPPGARPGAGPREQQVPNVGGAHVMPADSPDTDAPPH